jgi:SAM-dependent methyltransferase
MKSYYDALYHENEHYWGRLPSPVSLLVLAQCKLCKLLDLGAGQGPDAIFFAQRGFDVTAIDISPKAISDLKNHAAGLRITAVEGDMNELPQQSYAVVFSRMALQMIAPEKRVEYIAKLKETYHGALHVHIIPIEGACFGDEFICSNDLLKVAYNDWNVLFYEECWTIARTLNKNGEPYLMREARIIAKK